MNDLSAETLLTRQQTAAYMPNGCAPSYATWWRWHAIGVRGVQLETIMCGGRRCTTVEALRRFFTSLTQKTDRAPNQFSAVAIA